VVLARLDQAPPGPVSAAELAREVGVHRVHLARVFRAHLGCSIGDYHRRRRVAWAANELRHGEASLSDIALRAGFADQSHFSRVFKQWTGVTPRAWREGRTARPTQPVECAP